MRISGWDIEGFRQLRGQHVLDLPSGLTVIEGPNEAGKSTLRAFLTWMLFGAKDKSPEASSDPAGGVLRLEREGRPLELARSGASISLRSADSHEAPLLSDVLNGADRSLFEAVFCLGLSELNALQSLGQDALRERLSAAALGGAAEMARQAREQLRRDADGLWSSELQGRLQLLEQDLDRARALLSGARRRSTDYTDQLRKREAVEEAIVSLGKQVSGLLEHAERSRLRSEAVPLARDLSKFRSERQELGVVPVLDERMLDVAITSARSAADAVTRRVVAEQDARQARERLELPLDARVLDEAQTIQALAKDASDVEARHIRQPSAADGASAAKVRLEQSLSSLGERSGKVDLAGPEVRSEVRDGLRKEAVERADRALRLRAELADAEQALRAARDQSAELERAVSEIGEDDSFLRVGDDIERLLARAPSWERELVERDRLRALAAERDNALAEVGPVPSNGLPADAGALSLLLGRLRATAEALMDAQRGDTRQRERVTEAIFQFEREIEVLRDELRSLPVEAGLADRLPLLEASFAELNATAEMKAALPALQEAIAAADAFVDSATKDLGIDPVELSRVDASVSRRNQIRSAVTRLQEAQEASRKCESEIARLSAELSLLPKGSDPTADRPDFERMKSALETADLARNGRAPETPGEESSLSLPMLAAVVTIGLSAGAGVVATVLALGYAGPALRPVGAAIAGVLLAVVVPVLSVAALYQAMAGGTEVPEEQRRDAMTQLGFEPDHWPTDAEMAAARAKVEEGLESLRRRESESQKRFSLSAELEKQGKGREQAEAEAERQRQLLHEAWQGSGWRVDQDLAKLDRVAEVSELRARRNADASEHARLREAIDSVMARVGQTLTDSGRSFSGDEGALRDTLEELLLVSRISHDAVQRARSLDPLINAKLAEIEELERGETLDAAAATLARARDELAGELRDLGVAPQMDPEEVIAWAGRVAALAQVRSIGREDALAAIEEAVAEDRAAVHAVLAALGREESTAIGPDLVRELAERLASARVTQSRRRDLVADAAAAVTLVETAAVRKQTAEVDGVAETAMLQSWKERAIIAGYPSNIACGEFADFDRCWHEAKAAQERHDALSAELAGLTAFLDDWFARALLASGRIGDPTPMNIGGAVQQVRDWAERLRAAELAATALREAEIVAGLKQEIEERAAEDAERAELEMTEALNAIGCASAENVEPLRERMRSSVRLDGEIADRRRRIESVLGRVDDAMVATLSGEDEEGLRASGEAARQEVETTRSRLQDYQRELGGLSSEIAKAEQSNELMVAEQEVAALEANRDRFLRQFTLDQIASALIGEAQDALRVKSEPAVLRDAGKMLSEVTGGRWTKIVADPARENAFDVIAPDCSRRPVEALSVGTAELLYLCLRIALAADQSDRGRAFPLILDDVLVNLDRDRARAMCGVLAGFAKERQVFFLTARPEAVEMLLAESPSAAVLHLRPLPLDGEAPAVDRVGPGFFAGSAEARSSGRWAPVLANSSAVMHPARPVAVRAPPPAPRLVAADAEMLADPRLPQIMGFLRKQSDFCTRREIEEALGMRDIEAKMLMRILSEQGLVEAIGATKGRRYRAVV